MAITIHPPRDSRTALIAAIAVPRTRAVHTISSPPIHRLVHYVRVGAGDAVKDRVVFER
jgi:hypothetical protein